MDTNLENKQYYSLIPNTENTAEKKRSKGKCCSDNPYTSLVTYIHSLFPFHSDDEQNYLATILSRVEKTRQFQLFINHFLESIKFFGFSYIILFIFNCQGVISNCAVDEMQVFITDIILSSIYFTLLGYLRYQLCKTELNWLIHQCNPENIKEILSNFTLNRHDLLSGEDEKSYKIKEFKKLLQQTNVLLTGYLKYKKEIHSTTRYFIQIPSVFQGIIAAFNNALITEIILSLISNRRIYPPGGFMQMKKYYLTLCIISGLSGLGEMFNDIIYISQESFNREKIKHIRTICKILIMEYLISDSTELKNGILKLLKLFFEIEPNHLSNYLPDVDMINHENYYLNIYKVGSLSILLHKLITTYQSLKKNHFINNHIKNYRCLLLHIFQLPKDFFENSHALNTLPYIYKKHWKRYVEAYNRRKKELNCNHISSDSNIQLEFYRRFFQKTSSNPTENTIFFHDKYSRGSMKNLNLSFD